MTHFEINKHVSINIWDAEGPPRHIHIHVGVEEATMSRFEVMNLRNACEEILRIMSEGN